MKRSIALVLWLLGWSIPANAQEVYDVESGEEKGSGVPLTRTDGTTLYINPGMVQVVRAPLPGESGNAVLVFTGGGKQAVLETVKEVIDAMERDRPTGR